MTRTVYDEVREVRAKESALGVTIRAKWSAGQWRSMREVWENQAVESLLHYDDRITPHREALVMLAALAIAQIEALDRRSTTPEDR
jgi:hypothetical protein